MNVVKLILDVLLKEPLHLVAPAPLVYPNKI